jgi:3'-phosphoadenosine 5'-phosphosulfate sulfotransferase (PAPS reductase)/FAD synthetase
MNRLEIKKFELHAETDEYQRRVAEAVDNVEKVFDRHENPYVAISGGKDSTVLYHLITEQCNQKDIDVFHFDWGLRDIPGVEKNVRYLVRNYGGNLIYRTSERVNDEQEFIEDNHHGIEGIHGWVDTLTEEREWSCVMLGIRAQESPDRRNRFTGRPPRDEGHQIQYAPIHHLKTIDVWSYIVENDLPYHDMYDEKAELYGSIDHWSNRLVTLYDHEFSSHGSESMSQFLFPDKTGELKQIEKSHTSASEEDES